MQSIRRRFLEWRRRRLEKKALRLEARSADMRSVSEALHRQIDTAVEKIYRQVEKKYPYRDVSKGPERTIREEVLAMKYEKKLGRELGLPALYRKYDGFFYGLIFNHPRAERNILTADKLESRAKKMRRRAKRIQNRLEKQ